VTGSNPPTATGFASITAIVGGVTFLFDSLTSGSKIVPTPGSSGAIPLTPNVAFSGGGTTILDATAAVLEPSTLLGTLVGMLGVAAYARRRVS
jgi:hypothetical protein